MIEYDELLDDAFKRNLPVTAAYPRAPSLLRCGRLLKSS